VPTRCPMAKKAELEASFRKCSALCTEAVQAEADNDFTRLLDRAGATLPLLRESIAFLRRYQKIEAPNLPSVDLILRYAPPMFATRSLDSVDEWFAASSRSERKTYPDLPDRLADARRLLTLAVRVWPPWPAVAQSEVKAEGAEVAQLFNFWSRYGAVVKQPGRTPTTFAPVTHPRCRARGKCPTCGRSDEAAWADLLVRRTCPHCNCAGQFVIVARAN
jgi:hypothetical protein